MDWNNRIEEFEDIGMLDPFDITKSFVKAN